MAASYPGAVKSFSVKNTNDVIEASHVNDMQDEITAIENALVGSARVAHDLLFVDASFDIGKAGATRPRDLFLSRNATITGTLTLTGGFAANPVFTSPWLGPAVIQFGGTTSSFPALRRTAAALEAVLADQSNFAALVAASLQAQNGITNVAGNVANAGIYTSTGVQFSSQSVSLDGTVLAGEHRNTSAGTGALLEFRLGNDISASALTIWAVGGSYVTAGYTNSGLIRSSVAGGLNIEADHASGLIKFHTGGALQEKVRIAANGGVSIGNTTSFGAGTLNVNDNIGVTTAAPAIPIPNRMYLDNVCNVWAAVQISGGTPSILDDVNVASLTDNGVGDVTVNFAAALATATYAASVTPVGTSPDKCGSIHSKATGSIRCLIATANNGAGLDVNFDVVCHGV